MSYLRDYQTECHHSVLNHLDDNDSTLVVLPTGCGKTETGLAIVDEWKDGKCLWLAHREELIWQPWNRWYTKTDVHGDIEMGQYSRPYKSQNKVTFASKDSIWREKRLLRAFPDPKEVGLLIIDEAHHAVKQNKTYQRIIDHLSANPDLKILGLTATPDRTDELALGQNFQSIAYDYPLFDPSGGNSAIGDGWLVPIEQKFVQIESLDFDVVGNRGGDFIDSQLAQQMTAEEAMLGQCSTGLELAGDGTSLVFAASIDQAVKQAEILNRLRPDSAKAIASKIEDAHDFEFVYNSSNKQDRQKLLKEWNKGLFQFFCNVGIFTEGMDEPNIRSILMGRPTKSRSLYSQMAGRGTRVLKGLIEGLDENGELWRIESADERKQIIADSDKPHIQLIDFVGNSRHPLMSSYDILGGRYPDEVVERAKKNGLDAEENGDVLGGLEVAQKELILEEAERRKRAMERRKRLTATSTYKATKINPFGTLGLVPAREPGWHKGRQPTDRMKRALRKFKIEDREIAKMSFVQASTMMDGLVKRCQKNLASYKQCKLLAKYGEDGVNMSFSDASSTIDKIAKNGWKALP